MGAFGVVVGALASEDGRHGARTRHVATALHAAGMGTLVLDLLADGEATRRESVRDVPLLTDRLRAGVAWLRDQPVTGTRPIGLLAVGLAAGAALTLAGEDGGPIEAVASLAGRLEPARSVPDPAGVPTLVMIDDPDDLDGVTATFARWFVDHLGRAAARAVTSEGRTAD